MCHRRIVSALLIPVVLVQSTGCTKWTWVGPGKLQPEESRVRAVEYVDPSVADPAQSPLPDGVRRTVTAYFEAEPPAALDRDTLFVTLASGQYAIALAQVDRVEVRRPDNAKNVNIALATLCAAILVGVTLSDPDAWNWGY